MKATTESTNVLDPITLATADKNVVLQALLTGRVAFKAGLPLKECYVSHQFGSDWKKEMIEFASTLPEDEKNHLLQQVRRLEITRYTTRQLSQAGGEGVEFLHDKAKEGNVKEGVAFLKSHGWGKFKEYVEKEAQLVNWSDEMTKSFLNSVKKSAGISD